MSRFIKLAAVSRSRPRRRRLRGRSRAQPDARPTIPASIRSTSRWSSTPITSSTSRRGRPASPHAEQDRLAAWFESIGARYGDRITDRRAARL